MMLPDLWMKYSPPACGQAPVNASLAADDLEDTDPDRSRHSLSTARSTPVSVARAVRRPLTVLAADIGGTHSRFARCEVDEAFQVRRGPVFRMGTRQPGIRSFPAFWDTVRAAAPAALTEAPVDAIVLAVAGSVAGREAVLPNIDWDIRPKDLYGLGRVLLLNDFVAQGYAVAASGTHGLEPVRDTAQAEGAIAVIGAGTALGHCALYPRTSSAEGELPWSVAGSEAGHVNFAFHGPRELIVAQRMLELSGKPVLTSDDIVSGRGAACLHEALTGESRSAAEALAAADSETATWFARFYARACRHFCLTVLPVSRLVISGGLAAHNPHLVRSAAFLDEFEDAGEFRKLMRRIPIWLNTDQDIGIRGAAVFAAARHRTG